MKDTRDHAQLFEGRDIVAMLAQGVDVDDIVDDELTKGRIRTIYVQLKYRTKTVREIAEYYGLPIQLIRDIGHGKIFKKITQETYEDKDLFKSTENGMSKKV